MIKKQFFALIISAQNKKVYQDVVSMKHDCYQCEVCLENRRVIPHKIRRDRPAYSYRMKTLIWHINIYSPLYCKAACNRTMQVNGWWSYEFWQEEKHPKHNYAATFREESVDRVMRNIFGTILFTHHQQAGLLDSYPFPVLDYHPPTNLRVMPILEEERGTVD